MLVECLVTRTRMSFVNVIKLTSAIAPVSKSNAIGFEMVHFPQDFQHSKYAGEPNSELDTAWHLLLEGIARLPTDQAPGLIYIKVAIYELMRKTWMS